MIVKTAVFTAYMGFFQVFERRLQNRLEIMNESLTMLCAYCLIPFSGMVSDANTRYICGWPIIVLVGILVLINLAIILIQGVAVVIKSCKLRMIKRQNRKLAQKNVNKVKKCVREQKRISKEFKPEEMFCNLEGFGSMAS